MDLDHPRDRLANALLRQTLLSFLRWQRIVRRALLVGLLLFAAAAVVLSVGLA